MMATYEEAAAKWAERVLNTKIRPGMSQEESGFVRELVMTPRRAGKTTKVKDFLKPLDGAERVNISGFDVVINRHIDPGQFVVVPGSERIASEVLDAAIAQEMARSIWGSGDGMTTNAPSVPDEPLTLERLRETCRTDLRLPWKRNYVQLSLDGLVGVDWARTEAGSLHWSRQFNPNDWTINVEPELEVDYTDDDSIGGGMTIEEIIEKWKAKGNAEQD